MTAVVLVSLLDGRHEKNEDEGENRGPDVERTDSGNQLDESDQKENEVGDSTELLKEIHKQKVPSSVLGGDVDVARKSALVLVVTVNEHIQKHHGLHARFIRYTFLPDVKDRTIKSALAWVDIHVRANHVELFLRIGRAFCLYFYNEKDVSTHTFRLLRILLWILDTFG